MGLLWETFDIVTSMTPFISSKTLKNTHGSVTSQRSALRKLSRINLDIKYPNGHTTEICFNGCAAFSSSFAPVLEQLSSFLFIVHLLFRSMYRCWS